MSKLVLTTDALAQYLAEHRGRIAEIRHVKGKKMAQVVFPARGNKPQRVRTIEVA